MVFWSGIFHLCVWVLCLNVSASKPNYGIISSDRQLQRQRHFSDRRTNKRRILNPSQGDFKLLVLLVRFPEDANAQLPTRQYFDDLCNNDIKNYFNAQSYGNYKINECVVTDWVTTDNSAASYAGGASNLGPANVASKFFLPVLNQIDSQGMDWTQFDVDLDLNIDALLVLHSGYSAEHGVGSCNAPNPNDRIYSQGHPASDPADTWYSADFMANLNGFAITSAWGRLCTTNAAPMSVSIHELTHTLTAGMGYIPDLYNVETKSNGGTISGLGLFDPMSNAWGPDGQGVLNSYSPFIKQRLGWIAPTEITSDGVYEIRASSNYPDAYIIRVGFPDLEYLLIENRQQVGYDAAMPGSGLLIYHVDESVAKQDTPGYPGQSGWPQNGNHFMVALLQADGNYELEKTKDEGGNNGDAGDYWTAGMTLGSDCSVFPNTCTYQGGSIQSTGIVITDISTSSETMTFRVSGLGGALSTPSPSPPIALNTGSPTGTSVVLTDAPVGSSAGAVLTGAPTGSSVVVATEPPTASPIVASTSPTTVAPSISPTPHPSTMLPTNMATSIENNGTSIPPSIGDNSTTSIPGDEKGNKDSGADESNKDSSSVSRIVPHVGRFLYHGIVAFLIIRFA